VVQITKLTSEKVGGRGHYLNSRIELGSGVLDLIRTHCVMRTARWRHINRTQRGFKKGECGSCRFSNASANNSRGRRQIATEPASSRTYCNWMHRELATSYSSLLVIGN